MKKVLIFIMSVVLLGACTDDVHRSCSSENIDSRMFSFDSVTNPAVWSTFTSFEQMMEACQIPETLLKQMPTDTLVALCMNHPLAGNYIMYNNPIQGIKVVMEHFNGFQELKRRKDAPEKILDFYENFDLEYNVTKPKKNHYSRFRSELKPLQVGCVELYIATKDIPELYSGENLNRLEIINNTKYEQKLQDRKYNSVTSLSHSLMIGAQIKVSKPFMLNENEKKHLNQFLKGENVITPKEISEISRIIYSK